MKKKLSLALEKQWFYTYLIISVIPLILLIGIYIPMEKFALSAIDNMNDMAFTQVNDALDEHIKSIQKFSTNLLLNDDLAQISDYSNIDIVTQMRYYNLTHEVRTAAMNLGIDMRYYIYFKKSSAVLTENGFLSEENAFDVNYKEYATDYEEWNSFIKQENSMRLVRIESGKEHQDDLLLLLHTPTGADFTIAIPMNLYAIYDSFADFGFSGSVFLLDENDKLIYFFNGGEENIGLLEKVNKKVDKPVFTEIINGRKYAVSNRISAYGKYRYVIVNSKWPGFEILIFRIALVLFLVIAVVVILRLVSKSVRRHYTPIHKIMKQIEHMSGSENSSGYTMESLNSAVQTLEKYSRKIENIEKEARASLVKQQLLFENASTLTEMGYSEYSGGVAVVLVYPFGYENFFENETQSEQVKVLQFMMNNVLSEKLEEFSYMAAELNNIQAGIIAVNRSVEEMDDALKKILSEIRSFFEQNFDIKLIFAVGSYEKDLKRIHQSYINAAAAMDYKTIYNDRILFFSGEYKTRADEFFYSAQTAQKLTNYIKTGSAQKAVELLEEILDENMLEREISLKYFRYLLLHIFVTINNCAENLLGEKETELLSFAGLSEYDSYNTLKQTMKNQIYDVCDKISVAENSGNLMSKVSKCLEANYRDVNLSNSVIAEYCNLSTAYISVAFKKETGINLVDYIKMYRINKAKEYLSSTNLNIVQIASEVGFVNGDTFIRAFKKITGVTPGQWRSSIGFQNEQK